LGYDLISNLFKKTAIEEMLQVEKLAERILFLKGEVKMKAAHDVKKIHDVKQILEMATGMEISSIKDYNEWALECSRNADSATKKIFELLVDDEERHFDQYDKEMENLVKMAIVILPCNQLKEVRV